MKVLNVNIEEIHVRVRPIKTSYCLMLQSKAFIPDNMLYPVLFTLLNILFCVIRPIINTLFGSPILGFVSILEIILYRL